MFTKTNLLVLLAFLGLAFWAYHETNDDHHKDHAKAMDLVNVAVAAYETEGPAIIQEFNDKNNEEWHPDDGELYLFVIDLKTHDIIAPAARWANGMKNSERSLIYYLMNLAQESPAGTYAFYQIENPKTGELQPKRSFIKIYDDHLFGAGQFLRMRKKWLRY